MKTGGEKSRAERLKEIYRLQEHPEGGWFTEQYTSSFEKEGRSLAGSIYFLLDAGEISHFHQIDCDEIWYFHEGCGLAVTVLDEHGAERLLLGNDFEKGQRPMAEIPSGAIFAAECLEREGYCFVSCATAPKFDYRGFRLVGRGEIRARCPELGEEALRLAWGD